MASSPVNVTPAALEWALDHLLLEGDTDLFPRPFELDALQAQRSRVVELLAGIDLRAHEFSTGRRFIIPKDETRFRAATQLELVDTLLLVALLRIHGGVIEAHRVRPATNTVFSYRFSPAVDGRMYSQVNGWRDFWETTVRRADESGMKWIVVADISDYYNQLYHHTLENQLLEAKVPEVVIEVVKRFALATTERVSRGLPIGPHFTHLLAELCLSPCDRALMAKGIQHCRYVDDFHLLAMSKAHAKRALQQLAETLDSQQRLTLQERKTEILELREFRERADRMQEDQPISDYEKNVLAVIEAETDEDSYGAVDYDSLESADQDTLDDPALGSVVDSYLAATPVNYPRLGWLLRRLAQIGAPGALVTVLKNLGALVPIMGAASRYILRAAQNYSDWSVDIGALIVEALDDPYVVENSYLQAILINLVAREPDFDHIDSITARYAGADAVVKREIVSAAAACHSADWIRERKGDLDNSDPWLRRAIIRAGKELPQEEAGFWIRGHSTRIRGLDRLVANYAFPKKVKLGADFKLP